MRVAFVDRNLNPRGSLERGSLFLLEGATYESALATKEKA